MPRVYHSVIGGIYCCYYNIIHYRILGLGKKEDKISGIVEGD